MYAKVTPQKLFDDMDKFIEATKDLKLTPLLLGGGVGVEEKNTDTTYLYRMGHYFTYPFPTSAMSSTSPFSHAVSPSTARADAINDNRFIVATVLMVIWDYSHQKEYKSNEKTPAFRHF